MRMDATYSLTGLDFRKARHKAGLTQRQLAKRAGIHVNSLKRLERFGSRRILCSSWHSLTVCAEHLPGFPEIGRSYAPWIPAARPFAELDRKEAVQFSDQYARVRTQHGVLENPGWRPRKADRPRCGARTRKGLPCVAPARPNGRCRMHGGLSTGAKTPEGRKRIREAQQRRWARYRAMEASP